MIHNTIAQRREAKGWTAKQLAKECGFRPQAVESAEKGRGNYTIGFYAALANKLECSLSELLQEGKK